VRGRRDQERRSGDRSGRCQPAEPGGAGKIVARWQHRRGRRGEPCAQAEHGPWPEGRIVSRHGQVDPHPHRFPGIGMTGGKHKAGASFCGLWDPLQYPCLERPVNRSFDPRHPDDFRARPDHCDAKGKHRSSPALPPRPPATCTSAARARRCSTGSCPPPRRQVPAADRGYRSRPLDRAGHRGDLRRARWLGLGGDERAGVPVRPFPAPCRSRPPPARCRPRLSLLPQPGRARRPRARPRPSAPFRIDSEWRDAGSGLLARRPALRRPIKAPREGETTIEDQVQGRVTVSNADSTISSCCGPTAPRPTCWPWWSTITTWA
jgi:hypothetical protein